MHKNSYKKTNKFIIIYNTNINKNNVNIITIKIKN